MATFAIKSSSMSTNYEYSDENLIVVGNYIKDMVSESVTNINGTCYELVDGAQGDYVGRFNGSVKNNELVYSLSEMSRAESNMVWDAIDGIEPYVLGTNAE